VRFVDNGSATLGITQGNVIDIEDELVVAVEVTDGYPNILTSVKLRSTVYSCQLPCALV
jgi:hypothetical protein